MKLEAGENMCYNDYSYRQYIRKFSTCDILEHYSKESLDIYINHDNGVKTVEVPICYKKNGLQFTKHKFHIAQWNLLELCFNSIKYGNDYRNKKIDEHEHYSLINLTNLRSEILEDVINIEDDDLHKHLLCIANMEFDLEHPNSINKFNRIYHIMVNINKNNKYDQSEKNLLY